METAAVDREARRQLAEAILAYLSGELSSFAFEDRKWDNPAVAESGDAAVRAFCYDTLLIHDDVVDHPIRVPPETWQWLCRVVVLLRTDLPLTTVYHRTWHRKQLVGLGGVALIAAGIGLTFGLASLWPAVIAWVAAGLVALPYSELRRCEPDPELQELGRWLPFRNEQQWRGYEHLLAAGEVPPYDAAVHGLPAGNDAAAGRFRPAWLLFGTLYGTLWLPSLLRRETTVLHVVES